MFRVPIRYSNAKVPPRSGCSPLSISFIMKIVVSDGPLIQPFYISGSDEVNNIIVIPAKAGTQRFGFWLGPGMRGDDEGGCVT